MSILRSAKSVFCRTFTGCVLMSALVGCANGSGSAADAGTTQNASQSDSPDSAWFVASDTADRDKRMKLLTLVNAERAKVGVAPLTLAPLPNVAAQKFAIYLVQLIECDHSGENNNTPADRMTAEGATFSYWGENVMCGSNSPEGAMSWWMNSPGHKSNLLNSNFKRLGIGYYEGFWVQDFTD